MSSSRTIFQMPVLQKKCAVRGSYIGAGGVQDVGCDYLSNGRTSAVPRVMEPGRFSLIVSDEWKKRPHIFIDCQSPELFT
jgi:hypothetical protein